MEIRFRKDKDENEILYTLRICDMKDEAGLTWQEVADILNEQLGKDFTSSAYRKRYQYHKMCEAEEQKDNAEKMDYSKELEEKIADLKRERYKLNDVRNAYNRDLRAEARKDNLEELITNEISKLKPFEPKISKLESNGTRDMVINLCDIHYGMTTDNIWNKYNSDIAKERIKKYLVNIEKNQKLFKCDNAVVVLGGDLISGNIHKSIQLRNRENLIQQVIGVSELISGFVSRLSEIFNEVKVVGIAGNHSRLDTKDDAPMDERADDLIPWYLSARLQNLDNVKIIENDVDPTMILFQVMNTKFCLIHGDYDKPSNITNLLTMVPVNVDACIMGHMHHNKVEWIQNKPIIMSGSLCGVDDYSVGLRLNGRAQQLLVIVDETGITHYVDVDLR